MRAAAASGFTAVEMWGPTGADAPSTPKDLPALKAALDETGTQLTAQLSEPRTQFMIPPWDHSEFYRKLDEGVEIAHFLGTPRMVVGSGTGFGGWKRQVQLDKLIEIYQKAIAQIEGSGITLVLEPVNVRVDHPGSLLDRTERRRVRRPGRRLAVLRRALRHLPLGRRGRGHGRRARERRIDHEVRAARRRAGPRRAGHRIASTGPRPLATLRASGYDGPIGLEYYPTTESAESVKLIQKLAARRMSEPRLPGIGRRRHRRQRPGRRRPTRASSASRRPAPTIAMFEVGPTVSQPARRAREEHRRSRRARPRPAALGGTGRATTTATRAGGIVKTAQRRARPGTFLLETGYQVEGEDGLPVAAMSSNVGGMAAHWTGACPRPNDSERIGFLDDDGELDELLAEAERLLGVTTDAFDGVSATPPSCADRLAAAADDGRDEHERVQRMPLAVHRREDGAPGVVGVGRRARRCDARQPRTSRSTTSRSSPGCSSRTAARPASWSPTCARARAHEVRARYVVVAADALRTPQLLWASGIRPDALGQLPQRPGADRLRRAHPRLRPGARTPTAQPQTGLSEYSGVTWVPFTDEMPFHGQVMQLDASPVKLADDDPAAPGSIVGLGLFCAKDLQASDRVEFSDDDGRRVRDAGHDACTTRSAARDHEVIERAKAEIVRLGQGGRRAARRPSVHDAARRLAALSGHHPHGRRRTTARACARPTARSGRCPACSSPATASSPPRPRATRRSPASRSPCDGARHIARRACLLSDSDIRV